MNNYDETRFDNITKWYKSERHNYEEFSELILKKINYALSERNIVIAYSNWRAKTLESFCEKCKRTRYDENTGEYVLKYTDPKNQIMDYAGVRIVAYVQSDISLIQEIIEKMFQIDVENSQDKIKLLEDNKVGYLSIHYIASLKETSYEESKFKNYKCEIQVRTILQDAWAQIFHDRQYKNNNKLTNISDELKRKTSLIAGSLELIDQQINDLVGQYDAMDKGMSNAQYQRLLDSEITAEFLMQYFVEKFENKANKFYNSKYCIQVTKDFGINYIRELDSIIYQEFVDAIKKHMLQLTIDKLIMYILIVCNEEKYFSIVGENSIREISSDSFELLSNFVDMENICKKRRIVRS